MAIKMTMLFQLTTATTVASYGGQRHIGGWSESHVRDTSDLALAQQSYIDRVGPARAALLPTSATLIGARFQFVLPKSGRAQVLKASFPGSSGFITDIPQMSLNCSTATTGGVNVRKWNIRGIPDNQVTQGEYVPTPTFRVAADNYTTSGIAFYGFIGQDFTVPYVPIDSVAIDGWVKFFALQPYVVGDTMQILGAVAPNGDILKGKFKVINLRPLTSEVRIAFKTDQLVGWIGGVARPVVPKFFQYDITKSFVDRVTSRKIGRPSDQYRGRRSKKKLSAIPI